MDLPWVSRSLLESANVRAAIAAQRAQVAEERLAAYVDDTDRRAAIAQRELAEVREEVKLLLDRIVQMSGQPPIFHPAPPEPTPAPSPAASNLPAPETRVSFGDVHKATRKAIKDGELNILKRPN
jgi:hypothetical protein